MTGEANQPAVFYLRLAFTMSAKREARPRHLDDAVGDLVEEHARAFLHFAAQ
jgi:hypothetical protein